MDTFPLANAINRHIYALWETPLLLFGFKAEKSKIGKNKKWGG